MMKGQKERASDMHGGETVRKGGGGREKECDTSSGREGGKVGGVA